MAEGKMKKRVLAGIFAFLMKSIPLLYMPMAGIIMTCFCGGLIIKWGLGHKTTANGGL